MRELLNTLYITNKDAYLRKDGENVVVCVEECEVGRRPVHILESVVCMNYVGISPALMKLFSNTGVFVAFLDSNGRFAARLQGATRGNVL